MRLIDADELIEELKAKKVFITGVRNGRKIFTELVESLKESFVSVIEEQPTIENKYSWHDIRKNPDDLPKDIGDVLVCGKSNKKYVYFTGYYSEGWVWNGADNGMSFGNCKWEKVIAWREIEPFEEVSE